MTKQQRTLRKAVVGAVFYSFVVALLAVAVLAVTGCAASPQAQVDRAETLYGVTVGETNDLREQGVIDAHTFTTVITPARKIARADIDSAKAALRAGETDRVKVILDGVNATLLEIQKYRQKPATRPAAMASPAPQPVEAAVDPVTTALMLLGLISKLAPVAQKLVSGEELTPAERAVAEQYSADQTARADRLDAEARGA